MKKSWSQYQIWWKITITSRCQIYGRGKTLVGRVIITFFQKMLLALVFLVPFYVYNSRKKMKNHNFWSYLLNFGLQICLDPFIRQKFFCFVYRLHGTQNERLELTVSMQKSVLKNTYRVLRYCQNVSKYEGLVWRPQFGHVLVNISGPNAYFSKPIFALKP